MTDKRKPPGTGVCVCALGAVILMSMLCGRAAAGERQGVDPFVQNQKLGRGVNIIGYDPIWTSRDKARFQAGYFRMLKDAGFQNVRINLHPFRHMEPGPDHTLRASWWEVLDWAVTNALQSELVVILDLHEFGVYDKAPMESRARYLAFVVGTAAKLGWSWAYWQFDSDFVLYDIPNERWVEPVRDALTSSPSPAQR